MIGFIAKLKNHNKGSILFMSVLILTGILTVTLTIANLALSGIIIGGTQVKSIQAYYAADAGIEHTLYWSRASTTATSTLENDIFDVASSSLSNGASYSVDYTTWGQGLITGTTTNTGDYANRLGGYVRNFKSDGEYASLRRTIEAQFGFVPWDQIVTPTCDKAHLVLCEDEVSCELAGFGYWYNGVCNENPPKPETPGDQYDYDTTTGQCDAEHIVTCENQNDCEYYGGYWYFDACNLNPCNCDNELNCTAAGGYWYNNVCNKDPE